MHHSVSSALAALLAPICLAGAAYAAPSPAGTDEADFSVVHAFAGKDGLRPWRGRLIAGEDGWMYGTTLTGGPYDSGCGTIYRTKASGEFEVVHAFKPGSKKSGCGPSGGLRRASDGRFYGVTTGGGLYAGGTIYALSKEGEVTLLHSFAAEFAEGREIMDAPTEGPDGVLYGVAQYGGQYDSGTAYAITPAGEFSLLHHFGADDVVPAYPAGALTLGPDGLLYGVTVNGGVNRGGTIFTMTSAGAVSALHSLDWRSASWPYIELLSTGDGMFYGATISGGKHGQGSVFSISSDGRFEELASFEERTGYLPGGPLVLTPSGRLYGAAAVAGKFGHGTVFSVPRAGGKIAVHHNCRPAKRGLADCSRPKSGLLLGQDGFLYGSSEDGGGKGRRATSGAVYRLSAD